MQVSICGVDADEIAASTGAVDCVSRSDAELIVTVGEDALLECAVRNESRPIVPLDIESPLSPSREQLSELLSTLSTQPPTVEITPLSVTAGGTTSTAVFDTTLVTTEPARISEYAISVAGRRHAEFRADGVVVATPLGSSGYSRAAGGPQLEPGTGVAVVPIAPFATHTDTWIIEPPLTVRVERDDSVTVFADTTRLAAGETSLTAAVQCGEPLSIVETRGFLSP